MKLTTKIALLTASFILVSTAVYADGDKALTNNAGMTLYTFNKDSKDKSLCYDACATYWPPYIAGSYTTKQSGRGTIEHKDGTKQWRYKGQPLYT